MQATVAVVAFIKQARLIGWAFAIGIMASIWCPLAVLISSFDFAPGLTTFVPRLIEALVPVGSGMISLVSSSLMLAYVVKLKPGSIR